jgi:hypothetical protein
MKHFFRFIPVLFILFFFQTSAFGADALKIGVEIQGFSTIQ